MTSHGPDLNQQRERRVNEIVELLRQLAPSEWQEAIDRECGDDHELRDEVEAKLGGDPDDLGTLSVGGTVESGEGETGRIPDPAATLDVGGVPVTVSRRSTRSAAKTTIPGYKIVNLLGEGGMGEVYLAEAEGAVRRRVALKIIKLGMDTKEVVARFESERQALALMEHPNIARVYDAGSTEQGRPYFVMEHVQGEPITKYCDRHRLSTRERLELFVQVCNAIQHAHQKSIIHRDIKPSNTLIGIQDGKPTPKIIDFGVSKALDQRLTEKTVHTELGQMIGTPEYMSPEQAEIGVLDIDTRTDIYSLGVLLYELISGELPFDSRTLRTSAYLEVQRIIREVTPQKPSTRLTSNSGKPARVAENRKTDLKTLTRQVRGDLDWITMKALEKDRVRRYPTASEFAADVIRYLKREPVLAGPPSTAYRLRKFFERRKVETVSAVVVVALLVGITLFSWYAFKAQEEKRQKEASTALRSQGAAKLDRYWSLKEEVDTLEAAWEEARRGYQTWQPVWERQEELEAWRKLTRARGLIESLYNEATVSFSQAEEVAPLGSEEKRLALKALEETYWERFQETDYDGAIAIGPSFYKSQIQLLGLGTYDQQLTGQGTVSLVSDPPAADVFCFRYEEEESHLVPLSFDPKAGLENAGEGRLRKPFLEVEKIWREDPSSIPFEVGDRLLSLGGQAIFNRGDLGRALSEVKEGEVVSVEVLRSEETTTLEWTPFAKDPLPGAGRDALPPSRIVDFREQLGLTFAGYPLAFDPGCHVGRTQEGAPLEVRLPRGSYLFVFKKEGFRETRLPLAIPQRGKAGKVRLFRDSEVPPGFLYVAAGSFSYGGDPEAFQSMKRGEADLKGFFMGRFEVTFGEYLEFLNDPETLERSGTEGSWKGYARPRSQEVQEDLAELNAARLRRNQPAVQYVRFTNSRIDWNPEKKEWTTQWDRRRPILDIPQWAAWEYADWLTRRDGGRWRYRLPTDQEWEKAARGADRRIYVWGNYLVWNFCRCANGSRSKTPAEVGISPIDESVYGIRDLAGSVSEYTSTKPAWRYHYISRRGGHWDTTDAYEFRIPTRNGILPWYSSRGSGFRLVVDAEPDDSP